MPKVNTPMAPIYAINKPFYDVADYGNLSSTGIPDGVASNSAMIIAAANAANTAGGGVVFLGEGTWRGKSLPLYANVRYLGAGKNATIVKLEDGANTDLFSAQTSLINLSASGGTSASGTLYGFGLMNLTLDGNRANQTGGPSYPLRFYGCDYILENVDIINGYTGNILSDWNAGNNWPTGAHSMESRWLNVKTTGSNGIGIEYGGPHDSQFVNVIPYLEGTHCLHLGFNSYGSQFSHLHAWSPGQNDGLTVYGQDDFGRSNQSGLGTSSDGQAWAELPASGNVTAAIASNQASFTGNGTEADSFFTLGSTSVGDIDIYERVSLGGDSANNTIGITFRFTDASNWYRAVVSGNLLYLQKKVAGTQTTITNTAFTLANNTNAWIRIQATGTTLKAKIWLEGNAEPGTWNITQTDSALSSGKFGIMAYINSSTATVDSFVATSPVTTPLSVAVLDEAQGAVYFENCQAESSRSVQVVILGTGCEWIGGNVFPATPYVASGFQIGQQAGAVPYAGQLRQSTGTTQAYNPTNCKINCRASNNQGPQGAIWFANDGSANSYELTIDQGKGTTFVGSFSATSRLSVMPYGLTADGTQGKGGVFRVPVNAFNAFIVSDGTNDILNVNTNGKEIRSMNGAFLRNYSDQGTTVLWELGADAAGSFKWLGDANAVLKRLGSGVMGFTGAIAPGAQSATAPVLATSGTIATSGTGISRVAPAGAVTGVILAAGTQPGQMVTVINESVAANTITFNTTASTSNVADAATEAAIPGLTARTYIWDSSTSRWYRCN